MSKQGATTSKKAPLKAPKRDTKSKSVVNRQRKKGAKPRAIDVHPDRKEIIGRILKGESLPAIERAYGLGKGVAWKYVQEVLAERVQEAVDHQAEDLEAQIRRIMVRLEKLYDAGDAYLQDPDDPTKYTLCPRMDEIEVVYEDVNGNGNIVNKKALLSTLLAKALDLGTVVEVKTKNIDNRKLLVDTSLALTKQLEVIARILGKIKPDGPQTLTVNVNQYMVQVNALMVRTLGPYPEARAAVVKELQRISADQPAEG